VSLGTDGSASARIDPSAEEEEAAASTHMWTVRAGTSTPTAAGAVEGDFVVLGGSSVGAFSTEQQAEALALIAQAGTQLLRFARGALSC